MLSSDHFLKEEPQSILSLFSIQAVCTTCQLSLNVENGDISQLLMHVRVFHKLVLTKHEEELSVQDNDNDNNFYGDSNPPSPSVAKDNLNHQNLQNHLCKYDSEIKEEAEVENVIPVSIKILKQMPKEKEKKKQLKKHRWRLTNQDVWKHWIKGEDGLCSCKYCGKTSRGGNRRDIRGLGNHTKVMHLEKLDEDLQKKIIGNRPRTSGIWSHFDACDDISTDYRKSTVFNCNLCNSTVFVDKTQKLEVLLQHLSEYHEDQYEEYKQSKVIVCSDCGKTFKCQGGLNYHVKAAHTEQIQPAEKPYLCTYCGKRFRFKISWKNHVANHTGKFNFFCSVCQKGFPLKSVLDRHFIIHTGEKPFKCDRCGQAFARSSHLNRHMKAKCH